MNLITQSYIVMKNKDLRNVANDENHVVKSHSSLIDKEGIACDEHALARLLQVKKPIIFGYDVRYVLQTEAVIRRIALSGWELFITALLGRLGERCVHHLEYNYAALLNDMQRDMRSGISAGSDGKLAGFYSVIQAASGSHAEIHWIDAHIRGKAYRMICPDAKALRNGKLFRQERIDGGIAGVQQVGALAQGSAYRMNMPFGAFNVAAV